MPSALMQNKVCSRMGLLFTKWHASAWKRRRAAIFAGVWKEIIVWRKAPHDEYHTERELYKA